MAEHQRNGAGPGREPPPAWLSIETRAAGSAGARDEDQGMTDEELIARLLAAPADGLGTENLCIAAADRIEALTKRENQLWDLLEEIDAQIDLAEEISEEFAEKVRTAIWETC